MRESPSGLVTVLFDLSYFVLASYTSIAIGITSAVVGVAVAPLAAPAVLGIVGFGAAGPVAGTTIFSLRNIWF